MKKLLKNYTFTLVACPKPATDELNRAINYNPSKNYKYWQTTKLNKYGTLTFCILTGIDNLPKKGGVYALYENNNLIYIGRAKNLHKRWGKTNYGRISPRNCFIGGQSTNCKINNYIYKASEGGNCFSLYFYETNNYINIEKELLQYYAGKLKLNKQNV